MKATRSLSVSSQAPAVHTQTHEETMGIINCENEHLCKFCCPGCGQKGHNGEKYREWKEREERRVSCCCFVWYRTKKTSTSGGKKKSKAKDDGFCVVCKVHMTHIYTLPTTTQLPYFSYHHPLLYLQGNKSKAHWNQYKRACPNKCCGLHCEGCDVHEKKLHTSVTM